jgi:hypothetical protein
MKLKNVKLVFTGGGVEGGRGWKRDVKNMHARHY